jgi:hypothetical protein
MDTDKKELLNAIQETLNSGLRVQVSTHLKSTIYDSRHVGMFKVSGNSLYAQRGKKWDCIDYCSIRFEKLA